MSAQPNFFGPLLYTFRDLVANNVVGNRMQLSRLIDLPIEDDPFPKPFRLSPNRVAFDGQAVREWVQRRADRGPREPKPMPQPRKNRALEQPAPTIPSK